MPRAGLVAILAGVLAVVACARTRPVAADADHDGLDDGLERTLAAAFLPALHEFAGDDGRDHCPWPETRPMLYRARPRQSSGGTDLDSVAITYVLLYAEDCGPLGHAGDDEAFTIFLHRDTHSGEWRRIGALAIAHQGTPAERRTIGPGHDIWISRDKHSLYTSFEACASTDEWIVDQCSQAGPPPARHTLLNVGEPRAPLTNDVGDVMLAAGADGARARALVPWLTNGVGESAMTRLIATFAGGHLSDRDQTDLSYLLFVHRRIWNHDEFLDAGDITSQLFHDAVVLPDSSAPEWAAEDGAAEQRRP